MRWRRQEPRSQGLSPARALHGLSGSAARWHWSDGGVEATIGHTWTVDQTSITAAGAIDTFLLLLIGIGPKLALVPFVELTASLDRATKARVLRKMLTT